MSPSLQEKLPWTTSPLIINAPMAFWATSPLATTVTLAGGLGLLGSAFDMRALDHELRLANSTLSRTPSGKLPLGVGLLPIFTTLPAALAVLEPHQPVVVWLFAAAELADYADWARRIRDMCPGTLVFVQIGSVAAALEVVRLCQPDAVCLQGSDAGGHGFEKGASVVALVPEVVDVLAREGYAGVAVLAAGGIVDGRGVAAALVLGAEGVVMGTRFLAAEEAVVMQGYREAVLGAWDGGNSTVRSRVFDELSGPSAWPGVYDGRALVSRSVKDFERGVGIEEVRRLHAEAVERENKGFEVDGEGRAAVWAGTGVGLVKRVQSAREIVEEVRMDAVAAIERAKSRL
ncbi:hypothetical protein MBLNU230_g3923t1 [Neophaeotheca triangularis]